MGYVPAMKIPGKYGENVFCESLPIIELLDSTFEGNSLIPKDKIIAHKVRQICETVNAGMQPLQNLTILRALKLSKDDKKEFIELTQKRGLAALEALVEGPNFCVGNTASAADLFLVPQMRNIIDRHEIDTSEYPKTTEIYRNLIKLPIFVISSPSSVSGTKTDPAIYKE